MRKIYCLLICMSFIVIAAAQDSSSVNRTKTKRDMRSDTAMHRTGAKKSSSNMGNTKYCASMSNGKMVLMSNGKTISQEVNLDNGDKITADGALIKKDGSKTMLKSGECVDKAGMMSKNSKTKKKSSKARSNKS